jgi:hypothetical protein
MLVLAAGLWLVACHPYDPDLLPPLPGANGGSGGTGGMGGEGGESGGSGGVADGGGDACVRSAVELCNRIDDNCDGEVDEGTDAMCSLTMRAESECVRFGNTARCVIIGACHEGYDLCDGNPANGCEPYCDCNPCDDAGTEDGGQ